MHFFSLLKFLYKRYTISKKTQVIYLTNQPLLDIKNKIIIFIFEKYEIIITSIKADNIKNAFIKIHIYYFTLYKLSFFT